MEDLYLKMRRQETLMICGLQLQLNLVNGKTRQTIQMTQEQ